LFEFPEFFVPFCRRPKLSSNKVTTVKMASVSLKEKLNKIRSPNLQNQKQVAISRISFAQKTWD